MFAGARRFVSVDSIPWLYATMRAAVVNGGELKDDSVHDDAIPQPIEVDVVGDVNGSELEGDVVPDDVTHQLIEVNVVDDVNGDELKDEVACDDVLHQPTEVNVVDDVDGDELVDDIVPDDITHQPIEVNIVINGGDDVVGDADGGELVDDIVPDDIPHQQAEVNVVINGVSNVVGDADGHELEDDIVPDDIPHQPIEVNVIINVVHPVVASEVNNDLVLINESGSDTVSINIEPMVWETKMVAPDGGRGWHVAAACFMISFLTIGYSKAFVALVLAEYSSDDLADVSWIKAAPTSIPLVVAPLSGLFLGRFGHRATFALGYFLCVTAMCLGHFSSSTGALTRALSFLLGVGLALGSCATLDSLKKHFVLHRPAALTVNAVGGILGGMVSPYWVGGVVSALPFKLTWFVWAAVFLTILILGLRLFGDPEDHFIPVTVEVPSKDTAEVSEEVLETVEPPVNKFVRVFRYVYELLGFGFLADPRFVLSLIICVGTTFGNTISAGAVVSRAKVLGVNDFGLPLCVGVGQLTAAFTYGLFNRRSPFTRHSEYLLALGLAALSVAFPLGCGAYWQLAAVGVFGGFFSGVLKSLPTLVLIECHGAGNLVGTLNLLKMVEGLTKLSYPSVASQFVDAEAVARFNAFGAGAAAVLGGVLHMVC
jgi:hypothetical protein